MKERNFKDFASKLYKKAEKNKFPLRALIELTYRCNFKCPHCYVAADPEKKEISAQEVIDIIDQLSGMGCFYFGFTGGEIFLREDIFEIINHTRKRSCAVVLLTNGYFIDEKCADRLQRLRLNKIDITINAATEETFEKISGVKGSFDRVYNAVRLLKERKAPVCVKSCITRQNIDEFAEMKKFAESVDEKFRYNLSLIPRADGERTPLYYRVSLEEAGKLSRKFYPEMHSECKQDKPVSRFGLINGREKVFRCNAGRSEVAINPYGEMKLCLEIPYPGYNVLKGSLKEGWRKCVEFVENFKPGPDYKCGNCSLAGWCVWCPAKGLLEEGSLTACSPYYRQQAIMNAKLNRD